MIVNPVTWEFHYTGDAATADREGPEIKRELCTRREWRRRGGKYPAAKRYPGQNVPIYGTSAGKPVAGEMKRLCGELRPFSHI